MNILLWILLGEIRWLSSCDSGWDWPGHVSSVGEVAQGALYGCIFPSSDISCPLSLGLLWQPWQLEMEDEDTIDVFQQQTGGTASQGTVCTPCHRPCICYWMVSVWPYQTQKSLQEPRTVTEMILLSLKHFEDNSKLSLQGWGCSLSRANQIVFFV